MSLVKVQFGCGSNRPDGWLNFDIDAHDISKPLQMFPNTVDRILAEHVLEHIPSNQGYLFIEECFRILKKGGQLQIVVPDITRVAEFFSYSEGRINFSSIVANYLKFYQDQGWGDNPIRSLFVDHGHQSAWTRQLLFAAFKSVGFELMQYTREFDGARGHHKVIGVDNNELESVIVTGRKP